MHDGHDWMYVLDGRMRLLLGDQDLVIEPGEAVEFSTRTPHWFGAVDGAGGTDRRLRPARRTRAPALGSRNERPLTRYFPELVERLLQVLPPRCVVDGEIVVAGPDGLDFDALQQRIHPAESRVKRLSEETPASFVAFDLLALDDRDLIAEPLTERRALLADGHHRRRSDRCTSRRPPPIAPWPPTGSCASRAPGSTGSWPSRRAACTSPTSGCSSR